MNKNELNLALLQVDTRFENQEGNLSYIEELIGSFQGKADIFLLPELFNTGYKNAFSAKPETMNGHTHRWMKQVAERTGAAIAGSVSISENGMVFNRLLFVRPDGITQHYDKVNVFAFSGEDKIYKAGNTFPRFDWLGWNIKPMVCFDLRFPETARNHAPFYDLVLCPAHWPSPRIQAWDKLIPARAIENQAYFAAVNRIGREGDVVYPGHSCIVDFLGNHVCGPLTEEGIFTAVLEKEKLLHFRKSFPFLKE